MARIYRLSEGGGLARVEEKPFADEANEMESFVSQNPTLVGDIFVLGSQVNLPMIGKRADMIGIDREGSLVVIELKNVTVGHEVLGQVAGYAYACKNSPDFVRVLWENQEGVPDDVDVEWENPQIRIIVVAPDFDPYLPGIAAETGLKIEFVSISRYLHGSDEFVIVDKISEFPIARPPPPVTKEYNWEYYESSNVADEKQADIAKNLYDGIVNLCQEEGWEVKPKFNKNYIAFKLGFFNCYTLEFRHRGKVAVGLMGTVETEPPKLPNSIQPEWDGSWNYWFFEVGDRDFDVILIRDALKESFESIKQT